MRCFAMFAGWVLAAAVFPAAAQADGGPKAGPVLECTGNRLGDGSFEAGLSTAVWALRPIAGAVRLYEDAGLSNSGNWHAEFTGSQDAASTASVEQSFNLPAFTTGKLTFYLAKRAASGNGTDKFEVLLDNVLAGAVTEAVDVPVGQYLKVEINLAPRTAAQTALLALRAVGSGSPGPTRWLLDDVCLQTGSDVTGPCDLTAVSFVEPEPGARLFAGGGAAGYALPVEAETDCPQETASVAFHLEVDGVARLLNEAASAPYTASLPLEFLAPGGVNVLRAVAASSAPSAALPAEVAQENPLTVLPAGPFDADANALPDDAFAALDRPGDRWVVQAVLGARRGPVLSYAARLAAPAVPGQALDIEVTLDSPANPGQRAVVTVPGDLLANETGLLIVQTAEDLASLVGAGAARGFAAEPAGGLAGAGQYLHVSLLLSASGGAVFNEIEASRLVSNPIKVRFEGLPLTGSEPYRLLTHRTRTADGGAGLAVAAVEDVWRALGVQTANPATGIMIGELVAAGVVAPFEEIDPEAEAPRGILATILVALGVLQLAGGGGPCFIATAAYGTPVAAELDTLRVFRDHALLGNAAGTAFVDAYYRVSPPIADVVARAPALAAAVRVALLPAIALARAAAVLPAWSLACAAIGALLWRAARRRAARRGAPRTAQ